MQIPNLCLLVPSTLLTSSHITRISNLRCNPDLDTVSSLPRNFKLQTFKNVNVHSIKCEWHGNLPSTSHCWRSFSSTTSHIPSLLQSVILLACSLSASPCMPGVVWTTVLFKLLYCKIKKIFCVCVFYILFPWKVLLTYYSTTQLIVLVE